jgi:hypothetical protein
MYDKQELTMDRVDLYSSACVYNFIMRIEIFLSVI